MGTITFDFAKNRSLILQQLMTVLDGMNWNKAIVQMSRERDCLECGCHSAS
jgi:hypothetical protein